MDSVLNTSPRNGLTVLISGAGVGGLMTALECWRRGFDVRIFEGTTSNQTQGKIPLHCSHLLADLTSFEGDSFVIGPSALDAFRNWPQMQQRCHEIAEYPLLAYHNEKGERLAGPMDMRGIVTSTSRKNFSEIARHSRPVFHGMLLEQLSKIGISVEYDHRVADYFEDADRHKAGVVLQDGSRHEANLVVAADGGRGKSWSLIAGHPVPARSSGTAMFRVAFPVALAEADPQVAARWKLPEDGRPVFEMWIGPDVAAFFYRTKERMDISMMHPDLGIAEESWGNRVSPQEWLKVTATIPGWPEVADRAIKTIPADRLVDWKLMWRDPQPKWTSPEGLVVQLGDAAHTFLPSSGNGGTQAIEDAISLATCLQRAKTIPQATRVHNLLRFERASCLQAYGVLNQDNRNTKKHSEKENKYRTKVGPWIVDHDPEVYAEENFEAALKHLEEGTKFKNTNTPPGMVYRPWTIDGLLKAKENGEPTVLDGQWE